ncbi:MAG: cytochrome P450 [Planctomycetota bacterium]
MSECPFKKSEFPDAFAETRKEKGLGYMDDQNDPVQMVMRLRDLRKCAHDWQTYSSAGEVGRTVVPSEVSIRDTRQIPFEVDPPEHRPYRDLVEDWFKRPMKPEYHEKVKKIIDEVVDAALDGKELDVVSEFALLIQSRALTLLLNSSNYDESDVWIGWGTHVFRSEGEDLDGDKAALLYEYIDREIDRAEANPCGDLYSVLLESEFEGRKLTKEEIKGVMILTFAGGRDTVINFITNSIAYFAENFDQLLTLKDDDTAVSRAIEELVRYFSPLTQLARVATKDAEVCGSKIEKDTRISLCYAAANRDETVFKDPNVVDFNRKMNPHVAFGFSTHSCLGNQHARAIMRMLIKSLIEKVGRIELTGGEENIEELGEYRRKVGFNSLTAKFYPVD